MPPGFWDFLLTLPFLGFYLVTLSPFPLIRGRGKIIFKRGVAPLKLTHYYFRVKESQREVDRVASGEQSLCYIITIPPHDRNIYPYHGAGDKGG